MSEHGRLFTGEMVRAILAGVKTQTRRPLRPKPDFPGGSGSYEIGTGGGGPYRSVAEYWSDRGIQVGDSVWVREAWNATLSTLRSRPAVVVRYRASPSVRNILLFEGDDLPESRLLVGGARWRPSIHMPRWASRIVLPVIAKREERLQDITDADVIAEGVEQRHVDKNRPFFHKNDVHGIAYRELWDSIYGSKPGLSWADNPWVQVTEWEPLKPGRERNEA